MKRSKRWQWRKYAGICVLGFVSLGGISLSAPGRHVLNSARSFLHYYHVLEQADVPTGFWERVLFSLVLAGAHAPGSQEPSPTATSSS
jgi:hypothetical protein